VKSLELPIPKPPSHNASKIFSSSSILTSISGGTHEFPWEIRGRSINRHWRYGARGPDYWGGISYRRRRTRSEHRFQYRTDDRDHSRVSARRDERFDLRQRERYRRYRHRANRG